MDGQLAQVLSQIMETMRGMQAQQASLQTALQGQDIQSRNVGGITLQPYDEDNETVTSYLQRLENYI